MNARVSIITGCYNGERFIEQYVNVILSQSYSNIEVIFVDDGSIDKSAEKIKQYIDILERKNINLKYFYQSNQGMSGAINTGLKMMTGDYFILYDVDDLLEADCIKKRVEFLECNRQYGFVRSKAWYAFEDNLARKYPDLAFEKVKTSGWIFDDVINHRIGPGTFYYLFRTIDFVKINPSKQIYDSRYCQDIQILYMMAYAYPCGFIDEYQGIYVRNLTSHSCSHENYADKLKLIEGYENVVLKTLDSMNLNDKEKKAYKNLVVKKYLKYKKDTILYNLFEIYELENNSDEKFIIFGAGIFGKRMLDILKKERVKYFIDNNEDQQTKKFNGISVRSVHSIANDNDRPYIIIAAKKHRNEMENQLKRLNLVEGKDFMYYKDFIYRKLSNQLLAELKNENI